MITIDLDKARAIAHEKRRETRAELFKPHDERIKLSLPGDNIEELDAPRQEIRELDHQTQVKINQAETVDDLLKALSNDP